MAISRRYYPENKICWITLPDLSVGVRHFGQGFVVPLMVIREDLSHRERLALSSSTVKIVPPAASSRCMASVRSRSAISSS